MSDVTVIGLGSMGSALARALIAGRHEVTVWNRSLSKTNSLVELGALAAPSVAAAIAAAPIMIACVDNYASTRELLGQEKLAGKVLVQLSTGTPNEAREAKSWVQERGADYLDGAIMEYPSAIGSDKALILISGSKAAYVHAEACLRSLAGGLRYLGENIAGAAALDMALLSKTLGMLIGVVHGAHLCEVEGISVGLLASVLPVEEDSRAFAEKIESGAFAHPGATMKTWYGAIERIERQARDARINDEFPAFVARLVRLGLASGYGDEDVTALVKVL
jgi:3-hydroxyisobutyrate dehydrogenase-like beta-hydroxyacid dehydrogenase